MPGQMKAIVCNQLSKTYKGESKAALDGLNLEVAENSVFGFLGPNGAGKTTTIRILTSLMKASRGEASVAGNLVRPDSNKLKMNIGYLGQEVNMYKWMKGFELLDFTGEIFGFSKSDRYKRAKYLLELSGLNDAGNKKISSYSGGMLQRLGIAQAIMGKPKVLFLDEPTSALDPIGRKDVLEFIKLLSDECTVFMSTHILADVERVCTDVAIINHGKLVLEGSTAVLRKKFASGKLEIDFETETEAVKFSEVNNKILSGKIQIQGNTFSFIPENEQDQKLLVLSLLESGKYRINRLEWTNATLEDIFIRLIEKNN